MKAAATGKGEQRGELPKSCNRSASDPRGRSRIFVAARHGVGTGGSSERGDFLVEQAGESSAAAGLRR